MHVDVEDWKNGWFGIHLTLAPAEIDRIIELLSELKTDQEQHFHLTSDYRGTGGVGDIEVFVKAPDQEDNLFLGSVALAPGHELKSSEA